MMVGNPAGHGSAIYRVLVELSRNPGAFREERDFWTALFQAYTALCESYDTEENRRSAIEFFAPSVLWVLPELPEACIKKDWESLYAPMMRAIVGVSNWEAHRERSALMSWAYTEQILFERAKQKAKELLDAVDHDARFAILVALKEEFSQLREQHRVDVEAHFAPQPVQQPAAVAVPARQRALARA
jgi:hypothetical protein